jgi:hypothetical protein
MEKVQPRRGNRAGPRSSTTYDSRHASTWRDEQGFVVRQKPCRGMCRNPRCANGLRLVSGDYTVLPRCRGCQGCREFEQDVEIKRLQKQYPEPFELYRLRIKAPEAEHQRISERLHARPRLKLESGFRRDGPNALFFLGRSKEALETIARDFEQYPEIERIRFGHGRATWSRLTAGCLVKREAYGRQVKRWYVRGLPPRDKLEWKIMRVSGLGKFDPRRSPRTWNRRDNLVLVPPESWSMPRRRSPAQLDFFDPAKAPPGVTVHSASLATFKGAAQPLPAQVIEQTYAAHRERRQAWLLVNSDSLPSEAFRKAYASSPDLNPVIPRRILSDAELARPGPTGAAVWQERECREAAARRQQRASSASGRPLTVAEQQAFIDRMMAIKRKKEGQA